VHGDPVAPSRLHVTVENGLETENVTVAEVDDVVEAGPLSIVTVGAGATTVQACVAELIPPALPAATTRVWGPSASPMADHGLPQVVAEPPSRLHVTVASGSETLKDTSASVAEVDAAGPPVTVTSGGAGCDGGGVGVGAGVGAPVGPAGGSSDGAAEGTPTGKTTEALGDCDALGRAGCEGTAAGADAGEAGCSLA
jgi:hypothetical protein